MRFDIVKIDLSLVQGGALQDPSHAVLGAIRELADRWSASVVAEGVETAEQLVLVRSMGIASGQGYLLGRPAPTRNAGPLDLDALGGDPAPVEQPPELRVFTKPLSKSA
jgi:EAL domain-containing protein (putative c-di-GMP-specific phosphodiesterase class I)